MHKIYLLEELNFINKPILVGRSIFNNLVFQHLITHTRLQKYDWQVISNPLMVKDLVVARPMPYDAKHWRKTKALFIENGKSKEPTKRLFINRSGRRKIINLPELKPIFKKWGIEIIDPGTHSLSEQVDLFNSSSLIVGIHGAGLTNLAFCDYEKVKVLEISASDGVGCHYYWLCTSLGIDWQMILGEEGDSNQSFKLSANKLEDELEKLLSD
jgi:capsular polysaccharide biosynthesis protein